METQTSAKTKWIIDPTHSEVQFKVKHLVISTVTGSFKSFEGQLETAEDFEQAQIEFRIHVDSIDTNQEQRDAHLKSADFFNAEQFPQIVFTSDAFTRLSDEDYLLKGQLTIRDVTRPVQLNVLYGGSAVDFYGNEKAGFEVCGKINRKEFGLTWDGITEAGAIVVGEDIRLQMNIQLAKQNN